MISTETRIGRVTLKNPVICGSGEHVMTEAGLRSALAAGVGAVVAKSVNETQAAKDQLDRTDYALLDGSWNRLPWDCRKWISTSGWRSAPGSTPRPPKPDNT
jgi:dihydroorotate dehydrogenase (NAD+) catalytic subunit